jgi:predicted 2-oxoglutarate/Fe(II)-dependent dioxygenase YbiX
MTTNLKNYIKVYNTLEKSLCKKIRKELENIEDWKTHTFYSYDKNDYKPKSDTEELDISWSNIKTKKILTDKIWKTIYQYIIVDFKSDYFKSWNGFTSIRFNRYKKGKLMAKHCDHIKDMFDGDRKGIPTLSVVGLLNDNFEGGEFVMFDDYIIKLKQGDVLIFPSNFLYPHKVNPVKKGIRDSFVSWVW